MSKVTRPDPKPIGYDVGPRHGGGYIATLVHEDGSLPLIIAQGRSLKRTRKHAARAVIRKLHEWERRQANPKTRVILVPPTRGPQGPAGDSSATRKRRIF